MRRRINHLLTVVLFGVACDQAVAPSREPTYEFDLYDTGLVFNWPSERLPIRYWVAGDAGIVGEFVERGVQSWEHQFLYGEYRGVIVQDSTDADVLVWVDPPNPPAGAPTDAPPVVTACRGETTDTTTVTSPVRLVGPFRVFVSWRAGYADEDVVNCLERVTVHEIGHTIGLLGHSPDQFDLMTSVPQVASPSARDRATAEALYHTTPTVAPPEGR